MQTAAFRNFMYVAESRPGFLFSDTSVLSVRKSLDVKTHLSENGYDVRTGAGQKAVHIKLKTVIQAKCFDCSQGTLVFCKNRMNQLFQDVLYGGVESP